MGLFDKFKIAERKETFLEALEIDRDNWFQVFSACLGKMMVIQNACSELVVRGRDWNVDFSERIISFGSDTYPIQFIGSESNAQNTWLWGWENINGFSDEILSVAHQTKGRGEQWKLEPLTTAEVELDDTFNGHNLAIVTCGLLDGYCYYRGPHSGGAIFVAFSDVPKEVFLPIDVAKFSSLTMECIQQFHVDHKLFVEGFLLWNGTKYQWQEHTIVAQFAQELHIEFEQVDEFLRIRHMKIK